MAVAIVILNFNGRDFLRRFLPPVLAQSDGAEVWVADNGSTDDSLALLRAEFPALRVLDLGENKGFAGGYNAALAQVEAEFYVLLNSDVLVTPGWLDAPLQLLQALPEIAACQPKILDYQRSTYFEYAGAAGGYLDYLGYPFCRGRLFDTLEPDQNQYPDSRPVFWATGACLFLRAAAFREVGGFDADFFAHMEEIDLCWRLWNRGHEVWYCADSAVQHVGGGTLPKANPRKTFLNFRNGLALVYKNHPPRRLWSHFLLRLLLDGLAGLNFLRAGRPADCLAIVRAHFDFYAHLPAWRHKRRVVQATALCQAAQAQQYPRSLVQAYFLQKRRTFSALMWR